MKSEFHYDTVTKGEDRDWFQDHPGTEARPPRKRRPARRRYEPKAIWQMTMLIACVILGIAVSMLFKTNRFQSFGDPAYDQKKQLAETVKYLQTERNKLQTDLANARQTINEFTNARNMGQGESVALRKQLALVQEEAGWTALHGPGIVVELNDSPLKPKEGDDPNLYIVHDVDLHALVNELWASGAEAIDINDQRIVINSTVRCVGPTITVNGVRLAPPYLVRALGPAANLETGLRYTGGFMDSMAPNVDRGVSIKINQKKDMTVPAFTGSLLHRYAQPAKGTDK